MFRLINYFDVLGNPKEGWEVNNLCVEKEGITIVDDATEKEILHFLKEIRFLTTDDMRRVRLENYGDGWEIYAVKGWMPLGRLELDWARR